MEFVKNVNETSIFCDFTFCNDRNVYIEEKIGISSRISKERRSKRYEEIWDHRPRNPIKFLSFLSSFTFLIMKFVRTYDLNVETMNL